MTSERFVHAKQKFCRNYYIKNNYLIVHYPSVTPNYIDKILKCEIS